VHPQHRELDAGGEAKSGITLGKKIHRGNRGRPGRCKRTFKRSYQDSEPFPGSAADQKENTRAGKRTNERLEKFGKPDGMTLEYGNLLGIAEGVRECIALDFNYARSAKPPRTSE